MGVTRAGVGLGVITSEPFSAEVAWAMANETDEALAIAGFRLRLKMQLATISFGINFAERVMVYLPRKYKSNARNQINFQRNTIAKVYRLQNVHYLSWLQLR
jgi:hypothetical protein